MRLSLRVAAVLAVVPLSSCSSHTSFVLPSAGSAQAASARAASGYSEKVLYNFSSPEYGYNYASSLTPDGHGGYFGTTEFGGTGHGTVYEVVPNGKGRWKESTLYTFTGGLDGDRPMFTPLILDKHGNLYGITIIGGANEDGVAFEMQRSRKSWSEHVICNFGTDSCSVGDNPFSFVADTHGNFFGTANVTQGAQWTEAVFELSPSSKGWKSAVIFVDGIPSATSGGGGLAIDTNDNVFGISSLAFEPSEVFELSPSSSGWAAKVLYTFPRIDLDPEAPPTLDEKDNIYGATVAGGEHGDGTIYELTPSGSGPWARTTLHAFKGGSSDGAAPYASIAFDRSDNIYGTTQVGGAHHDGTVYELAASGKRYESKLLWSFDGKDGSHPFVQVVLDGHGDVFGTTTQGGPSGACYALAGCGNAFEIKRN
jgi:uncharacterized repeat protein (TIGR03803 family)